MLQHLDLHHPIKWNAILQSLSCAHAKCEVKLRIEHIVITLQCHFCILHRKAKFIGNDSLRQSKQTTQQNDETRHLTLTQQSVIKAIHRRLSGNDLSPVTYGQAPVSVDRQIDRIRMRLDKCSYLAFIFLF